MCVNLCGTSAHLVCVFVCTCMLHVETLFVCVADRRCCYRSAAKYKNVFPETFAGWDVPVSLMQGSAGMYYRNSMEYFLPRQEEWKRTSTKCSHAGI